MFLSPNEETRKEVICIGGRFDIIKLQLIRLLVKIILSLLLLLCLLDMPYGYYQFVRFTAMVGFCYLAYSAKEHSNKNEMFIFIGLALLFQPFFKIALGRTIWNIIDLVVGIGLLLSYFMKPKLAPK